MTTQATKKRAPRAATIKPAAGTVVEFSPAVYRNQVELEIAQHEPGTPEAHVPKTAIASAIQETEVLHAKWQVIAEAAYHAGARLALFPQGAHYMSDKSTPELNLLTKAVAAALYTGKDLELALAPKGAKLSSEELERRTVLRQRIGKKRNLFTGHLAAFEAEATGASEGTKAPGKPTGARQPKGNKVNAETVTEWAFGQLRSIVDKIQTCKDAPQAALELKAALVDLIEDAKQ